MTTTNRGRKTKLTKEVQDNVVAALRQGAYVETAAAFAGISKVTFYQWIKEGRAAKSGKKHEFLNAVEQAMAEAEMRDLAVISKAAKNGVWKAAAWRLEHRHPEKWGRRTKVEAELTHTGEVEHNHDHKHEHSVDDQLQEYFSVFSEILGEGTGTGATDDGENESNDS